MRTFEYLMEEKFNLTNVIQSLLKKRGFLRVDFRTPLIAFLALSKKMMFRSFGHIPLSLDKFHVSHFLCFCFCFCRIRGVWALP